MARYGLDSGIRKAFCTVMLLACSGWARWCAADSAGAPEVPADEWAPAAISLSINGQTLPHSVVAYRDRAGSWLLPFDPLQRANVDPQLLRSTRSVGTEAYVALERLQPLSATLDESTQTLKLELAPVQFRSTRLLAASRPDSHLVTRSPGGFLNYDLLIDHSPYGLGKSAYAEAGLSLGPGALISSHAFIEQPGRSDRLRLESTYVLDQPQQLATVRVGDAITRPITALGRAARFGGLQFGTNFGTQPGFVAAPLPMLSGQAALPATVDLYVNNVLQSSSNVPPGPFSVVAPPLVGGDGEVMLKVRDLSGREELISQRFYASGVLLAPGLTDYSVEAGRLRRNFGLRSGDYGDAFVSGGLRRGLSERMTIDLGAAAAERRFSSVSGGFAFAYPGLGVLSAALAWSRDDIDSGAALSVGIERRTRRHSLTLRTQASDEGFRQLGVDAMNRMRRIDSFFYSYLLEGIGAAGIAWTRIERFGGDPVNVSSLSLSSRRTGWGSFVVSLSETRAAVRDHSINLLWIIPVGPGESASAFHTQPNQGEARTTMQWQKNLPADDGFGYRLQAGVNAPQQASLLAQNRYGLARLEAAEFGGETSGRIGLSGALAFVDDAWFASRRIGGSFGIVRLPELPNVRIYVDNLPAGRTDERGVAFLPRLNAYARNHVSVEPLDLPLDTQIESLVAEPVPAWRSGVRVDFPVRKVAAATLNLMLPGGRPVPAGATASLEDGEGDFVVGYDGLLYLTGLQADNRLLVRWSGGQCRLRLRYEARTGDVPYLGHVMCDTGDQP